MDRVLPKYQLSSQVRTNIQVSGLGTGSKTQWSCSVLRCPESEKWGIAAQFNLSGHIFTYPQDILRRC